jgi:putative transposase
MSNQRPVPGDACYFLTLNTVDRIDAFVRPACKQVIADALNHFIDTQGLIVYAWCLMTGHLHLLIRMRDGQGPAGFERDFKKFTTPEVLKAIELTVDPRRDWMLQRFEDYSKSLKKIEKFHLWQSCTGQIHVDGSQPGLLCDRIDDIHENPVRDGIVELQEHYVYSSARDYAGMKGLVRVKKIIQQGAGSSRFRRLSAN